MASLRDQLRNFSASAKKQRMNWLLRKLFEEKRMFEWIFIAGKNLRLLLPFLLRKWQKNFLKLMSLLLAKKLVISVKKWLWFENWMFLVTFWWGLKMFLIAMKWLPFLLILQGKKFDIFARNSFLKELKPARLWDPLHVVVTKCCVKKD